MRVWWVVLVGALLPGMAPAQSDAARAALDAWLEQQTALDYWQAQVTQRRHFQGLTQALESTGNVWIAQPDRLRWELGEPPQTIAIRNGETLRVHHPLLGETEEFALGGEDLSPAGQQALALLAVGFPVSREAFFADYQLASGRQADHHWLLTLTPRGSGTQRILDRVIIEVVQGSWRLDATEFHFPDGSRMRNAFRDQQTGQAPDPALFTAPSPDS